MSDSPDDDRTVIKPVNRTQPPPAAAPTPAQDDHGNALPVGTYLGEFEVTSMLGEGGFGIVYLVWDHSEAESFSIPGAGTLTGGA